VKGTLTLEGTIRSTVGALGRHASDTVYIHPERMVTKEEVIPNGKANSSVWHDE